MRIMCEINGSIQKCEMTDYIIYCPLITVGHLRMNSKRHPITNYKSNPVDITFSVLHVDSKFISIYLIKSLTFIRFVF